MFPTRLEFAIGASLDLLLGDPRCLPHPVRGIGWLITRLEPMFRRLTNLRLAGCVFAVAVTGLAASVAFLTVRWMGTSATVFWIFTSLALRSLDNEAAGVVRALHDGNLLEARKRVAMIVGRDTEQLDEEQVTRAVFETVAENLSDGIVAPLFYLALGGIPGMVAYKAVNTLDSMVGYKNETYRDFGWASARLDDLVNLLPSRISAVLVIIASACLGLSWRNAARVVMRDARSQPSPNAGFPEAAFAGALGIRFGGWNSYGGRLTRKAFLGDALCPLHWTQYRSIRSLLYVSSVIAFGGVALCLR